MLIFKRFLNINGFNFEIEEHCFNLFKAYCKELDLKLEAITLSELLNKIDIQVKERVIYV